MLHVLKTGPAANACCEKRYHLLQECWSRQQTEVTELSVLLVESNPIEAS
jgi:hypothetical protein